MVTEKKKLWLPTSVKEAERLGWKEPDVVLFSGDAYVDHPAFGVAVIGRVLENMGLKVAIVPQPNWRDDLRDFKKFGRPRLFFGATAGNMDSMVNHYTANKRLRSDDAYSPLGKADFRPDYACYVYSKIVKELFPDVPLVIGGIEASLRRFTHYDYWSDSLKPSILADTQADVLVYGMAETTVRKVAQHYIDKKIKLSEIPQIAYLNDSIDTLEKPIIIASHEQCLNSKSDFAHTFRLIEEESNKLQSSTIVQKIGSRYVIVNAPEPPMDEQQIDAVYDLPYTRLPHPRYKDKPIPAFEMIKYSVNIHRGCFGGCSFCSISAHQGKFIQSRSEKSILNEISAIATDEDFRGHLSDLGGPSANMFKMAGENMEQCRNCKRYSCIYPSICRNLNTSHNALIKLYQKVAEHPRVNKITIGSGLRYDLFIDNPQTEHAQSHRVYFETIVKNHVSGRLKVAPEHTSDEVLKLMRKPSFSMYVKLKQWFEVLNNKYGSKQQLIPYLISNHPGTSILDMAEMSVALNQLNYKPEQAQGFTPTPMTLSSVMYYSGIDPYTNKKVFSAVAIDDKKDQQLFMFWYKKENIPYVKRILEKLKRSDIITRLYGKRNY